MEKKFKYDYFSDFVKKLILNNKVPLQVELHTGNNCGIFNCPHCYGKIDCLPKDEPLKLENWIKLIDDIHSDVKFIQLAGIKSEPLVNKNIYEIIQRIKFYDLRLGIHTKGYLLTEKLSDLLNINTAYGDFITFSVDSINSETYKKIHGINIKQPDIFKIVYKNIQYLYERKKITSSSLNINIASLLFKDNSSTDDLIKFVELFKNCSDTIRFSFPQIPNKFEKLPDNFLSESEKKDVENRILELKNIYPNVNIVFLSFDTDTHKTEFEYCYAQRFLSVIDFVGNVYPCPQVASEKYRYLSYGNIKNDDFWSIWNSINRKKILDKKIKCLNCRICDRKDEKLNIKLNELFGEQK